MFETHLDISTASVVSDSFPNQEQRLLHLPVLGLVSQPDDSAIVPVHSAGTPVDSSQAGILGLESPLSLHHLHLDGGPGEVLPDVLLHPWSSRPLRVAASNISADDPASLDSESLVQHRLSPRPAQAGHLAALLLAEISDLQRNVESCQSPQQSSQLGLVSPSPGKVPPDPETEHCYRNADAWRLPFSYMRRGLEEPADRALFTPAVAASANLLTSS